MLKPLLEVAVDVLDVDLADKRQVRHSDLFLLCRLEDGLLHRSLSGGRGLGTARILLAPSTFSYRLGM